MQFPARQARAKGQQHRRRTSSPLPRASPSQTTHPMPTAARRCAARPPRQAGCCGGAAAPGRWCCWGLAVRCGCPQSYAPPAGCPRWWSSPPGCGLPTPPQTPSSGGRAGHRERKGSTGGGGTGGHSSRTRQAKGAASGALRRCGATAGHAQSSRSCPGCRGSTRWTASRRPPPRCCSGSGGAAPCLPTLRRQLSLCVNPLAGGVETATERCFGRGERL